jgi:hypothetical protein
LDEISFVISKKPEKTVESKAKSIEMANQLPVSQNQGRPFSFGDGNLSELDILCVEEYPDVPWEYLTL